LKLLQSNLDLEAWYIDKSLLQSLFYHAFEYLVMLACFEYLIQSFSVIAINFWVVPSNISQSGILVMSICLTLLVSSLINLASSSLFLTIVLLLSYINSSLIMILIAKKAWLDGLHKSSKIVCVSNSSVLAWRNIKSITELKSLELFMYLVGIYMIGINSFRLNESVTSPRVPACTEWWGYDRFQSLSLILKSPVCCGNH